MWNKRDPLGPLSIQRTYLNNSGLIWNVCDWFGPIKTSLKQPRWIWTSLDSFGVISTNFNRLGPVLTKSYLGGPISTHLNQSLSLLNLINVGPFRAQVEQFEPNWTNWNTIWEIGTNQARLGPIETLRDPFGNMRIFFDQLGFLMGLFGLNRTNKSNWNQFTPLCTNCDQFKQSSTRWTNRMNLYDYWMIFTSQGPLVPIKWIYWIIDSPIWSFRTPFD